MTTEIQELSRRLAKLYGVDVSKPKYSGDHPELGPIYDHFWLAEDSGRVSDLADDSKLNIIWLTDYVHVYQHNYPSDEIEFNEYYTDHLTKSAAARMARVRCLIVIGEQK